MQVLRFHIRSDQILLKIRQLLLSFSFHVILTVTSNCTSIACFSGMVKGGLHKAKDLPEVASFGMEGSSPLGASHRLYKRVHKLQQVIDKLGDIQSCLFEQHGKVGFGWV